MPILHDERRRKYHLVPAILWLLVIAGFVWLIVWAVPQVLKGLEMLAR